MATTVDARGLSCPQPVILTLDEIKKGKCTDCVACELACQLHGNGGVTITYPMPKLDEYLADLEMKGMKPVYKK